MSTLHDASREGNTERVQELLGGDALLDEKDENGYTALMWASKGGQTEVVKLLLDNGASVNEKNEEGYTEAVTISAQRMLTDTDEGGKSALSWASLRGHTKVVKLLLDNGAPVDEKDKDGNTALSWASSKGHTEVVQLLLDKGAPVNEKDGDGYTALMWASWYAQTEVVKLLLDKGAPLNEKDGNGDTALVWASCMGRTVVVQLLLDKGTPADEKGEEGRPAALMHASLNGHTEVAKLLLEKGVPVHATVLMWALTGGNCRTELVQLLLDKGAPIGNTALVLAVKQGYTEVVKLLLSKGAPVDEKDYDGNTALLLAVKAGRTKLVKLLLGKGASVDQKNTDGDTALVWAVKQGYTEVVKLLLSKGALVDEKDGDGNTALVLAIKAGRTEVVKLLLNKGASVNEKDEGGRKALMLASIEGHKEVVQLLLIYGAPINDEKEGDAALPTVAVFDEDQLGRMVAAQVHRLLLEVPGCDVPAMKVKAAEMAIHDAGEAAEAALAAVTKAQTAVAELTAKVVLQLVRLAGFARDHAREKRSSDPRAAEDHQVLFARLQLAAAACVQNDELGDARDEEHVQKLLGSNDGRKALKQAVHIEAKEVLAQPAVQAYIEVVWRGQMVNLGWEWIIFSILLLLQLLFLLPLVALVPALEPWLTEKIDQGGGSLYLLRLPVVKFGLECAADLALALALTLIPAADLAAAPVAPLLLVWVGSGLLREGRQLMSAGSDASTLLAAKDDYIDKAEDDDMCPRCMDNLGRASIRLAPVYDRLEAYWADHINRVDGTALIFSFAALIVFVSTGDSEDATATSLRVVAVFLLWLRVIRVLLLSSRFGPFVLMFFRMLFGDVLYFLVLLLFLLVAFAASWTVLLEPESSLIAGCADELGGVEFHTTLLWLLEGAVSPNDHFECARSSTNSPVAAWMISFVYVTLTAVLLLNMLIAMMAKTFDNISEASATNYLFLFAQRTLALQNEPPTPPPLNALGLPCEAMCKPICRLWARLYPERAAANKYLFIHLSIRAAEEKAKALSAEKLKAAVARATANKARRSCTGSWSFATGSWTFYTALDFAEKITPLAKKVTEYILDHQDDAAQEDRWRTTMKRKMSESFRLQREAAKKQRELIDSQFDRQREEVQKVEKEVQSMQQRFDLVHSKLDETIQIVKVIARQSIV